MAKKSETMSNSPVTRDSRPAYSAEAKENQMISLAYQVAEERLRNGTATAQEVTYFLKLGSTKEKIEKEILERQKDLIEAKTQTLQAAKRMDELCERAIEAMRIYSGQNLSDE